MRLKDHPVAFGRYSPGIGAARPRALTLGHLKIVFIFFPVVSDWPCFRVDQQNVQDRHGLNF